jgi:Domain of unknown function (DUF4350)
VNATAPVTATPSGTPARSGHTAGRRPGPAGGPAGGAAGGPTAGGWRGWRWPLAAVALILLSGLTAALLRPVPGPDLPLDPASTAPGGSHALADLLGQRGVRVVRAGTVAAAVSAAGAGPSTIVVTSPGQLTAAGLAALARSPGWLVLVAPTPAALTTLAPGVTAVADAPVSSRPPGCGLPAARLAGTASLGGVLLRTARPAAVRCYPVTGPQPGLAALVRFPGPGRTVTVLGTGVPLTNRRLAAGGNAALALNLLGAHGQVVWLVPGPAAAALPGRPGPAAALVPRPAVLVAWELAVAAVLAALWRLRRFGPLVAEPMPVVVRASETAEGHGRLYQARRARDRAAATLRGTTLSALLPRLGLPRGAAPAAVCAEISRRTGRPVPQLEALLYGPVPADNGALVQLAADLDSVESEVLTQ